MDPQNDVWGIGGGAFFLLVTKTNTDDDDDESDEDDVAREVRFEDGTLGYMCSARLFLEDGISVKVTVFKNAYSVFWKAEKVSFREYDAKSGLCVKMRKLIRGCMLVVV